MELSDQDLSLDILCFCQIPFQTIYILLQEKEKKLNLYYGQRCR